MDLRSFRQVAKIIACTEVDSTQHTEINFPKDIFFIKFLHIQALVN